jgi:hypothetical protein
MEILYISPEAREILKRRGVTFDAAIPKPGRTLVAPAKPIDSRPAAVQLREYMRTAPAFGGDAEFQRRALELQNLANAEYWNPPVAPKGAQ